MFGYIVPDKNNMYIKDFNVFQGFYCGLCKTLGKTGGPLTRLCTNYDTTFYNAFLHAITNTPVVAEGKFCALNGKKKPVIPPDDLSMKVADVSVLLVYYNLCDDVEDGKKIRAIAKWRLYLRKRAAAKRLPDVDKLMREQFGRLAKLEKNNSDSIDEVADCTAVVMRDMTRLLVPTTDEIDVFTYNLGRLIYLMDAVDDIEEDSKKGTYNVVVNNYGKCTEKAVYLKENADELAFLLKSTYNRMVGSYNKMNVVVAEGVISNTVYLGIDMQIKRLLKGEDKCHKIRM